MQLNSLTESLRNTVKTYPSRGIYYVNDNGSTDFQSYQDLMNEAVLLASGFHSGGMSREDKVIIATLTNRQTITSLWGCFFAGIVPTILQAPVSLTDKSQAAEKMLNVYQNLDQPVIIVSKPLTSPGDIPETAFRIFDQLPRIEGCIDVETLISDLAFIQFSSGSTGEPKGIMLTHSNLAWNIHSITVGLDITHEDRFANWMPLYHDMGLIGYHMTPLVNSIDQYQIETIEFIKNPALWLEVLSSAKINIAGCPNFSQALILRHLQRKKMNPEWDFSSLKAILNGAEPISVKIMEDFTKALKLNNLPDYAMMPVYGMAESTLAISFTPIYTPRVVSSFDTEELDRNFRAVPAVPKSKRHSRQLSSVGVALSDVEIRIADEKDQLLPEAAVGHIQIKGPAVTRGYYKNPQATASLFCGEWLRTGDIGFFLNGMLYISGRFKEIIFMNGKNYFANDLETLACTLEDITYGKVAMGGYTDPETSKEKIVIFVAGIPESKIPETLQALRTLFRSTLGIPVDELLLLRSNEFPKTSSGKIQRYLMLNRHRQGEYKNRFR